MTSRNGGEWTEARFKSFITSALRAASRRWPPKFAALKKALVGRKTNDKTGKLAQHYRCVTCNKDFVGADVQVDHIDRMFCELHDLQVLCKPCHKQKTQQEKEARKKK
jgi:5-methylcytosine-specific restriction endonuclease McrA